MFSSDCLQVSSKCKLLLVEAQFISVQNCFTAPKVNKMLLIKKQCIVNHQGQKLLLCVFVSHLRTLIFFSCAKWPFLYCLAVYWMWCDTLVVFIMTLPSFFPMVCIVTMSKHAPHTLSWIIQQENAVIIFAANILLVIITSNHCHSWNLFHTSSIFSAQYLLWTFLLLFQVQ